MLIKNHLKEIQEHFAAQSGDGVSHIATAITIAALLHIANRVQPQRILELGGGGGTLTYTLLKHTNAHVDVYEDLEFCRENLRRNCAPFEGRYTLINSYDILPPHVEYDMVIIDGPSPKRKGDWDERREIVDRFLGSLKAVRVVYIEGDRFPQRFQALRTLGRKYRIQLVHHHDKKENGVKYKGGLEIVCNSKSNAHARRCNLFIILVEEFLLFLFLKLTKKFRKL